MTKAKVKPKSNRGGSRTGAGKPKGEETTKVTFSIKNSLLPYLKLFNQDKFVNQAIREKLERLGNLISTAEEIQRQEEDLDLFSDNYIPPIEDSTSQFI